MALGRAFAQVPSKHSSWNQRTRSAVRATAIIQLALASKLVKGIRQSRSPSAAGCAVRRGRGPAWWRPVRPGRSLGVGVEAPVAEVETREQAALGPGVEGLASDDQPGARRAACRRSISEVSSHTAAPSRSSPSWREGRLPDRLDADGIADGGCDLGIRPCGDEEGDVAGPTAARNPSVHPAESARTTTALVDQVASSPAGGRRRSTRAVGRWRRRGRSRGRPRCWPRRCPDGARPDSTSPVASAKQNIGWKPNPPL